MPFIEVDSLLDPEDSDEVVHHLDHQEYICHNFDFIMAEDLVRPMAKEANSV